MGNPETKAAKLLVAKSRHRDHLASMAGFNIEPVCSAEAIAIKKWLRDRYNELELGLEHKYRVRRTPDFPCGVIGFSVDFFRKKTFGALPPVLLPGELVSPQICVVKLDKFGTDEKGFAVFPPVPDGQKVVVTNLTGESECFGMRAGVDSEDFPPVPDMLDVDARVILTKSQCLKVLLRTVPNAEQPKEYGSWGAFARQVFKAD